MPTEIESEIAERYAEALFNVSHESGRVNEHLEEAQLLRYLVVHARDFLAFLSAPHIDPRKKLDLLRRTLSARLSPTVMRLLEVLTSHGRITALPSVIEEFEKMVDRWRGIRDAVVRSAHALDEAQKQQLQGVLETFLRAKLKIRFLVDAELIGGIIVQSEDAMIDASVRSELQRLKYQLERASLGSLERSS